MPQLQLPIFPEGVTQLTLQIAFERVNGWITYIHGLQPVFRHEEQDVASFRLFTSQLIVQGVVQQSDIVKVFGVPRITVMRAVKLYRAEGPKGFFRQRRGRSGGVLKGETHQQVQALLDAGQSVPEVGRLSGVLPNTLHKAIRQGRLHQARGNASATAEQPASSKSERSETDSVAAMGYATTRSEERVAAAMGMLACAPIQFEAAQDVPQGGVLLALPALLANGLLRYSGELYALPNGFYGMASIFLLLALMALARIKSIEQLRYVAPGEWGHLLGLDRIPEVRTLREKLEILCRQAGRAIQWNTLLAKDWITTQATGDFVFYVDGHVRVYSGDLTALPRHYVARERLCLRGTTDYWINAMDGQPFFYVNKEVDPGLLATLRADLVPFLKTHAPVSEALRQRMQEDPLQHRFTLVFDREAYSPEFFREMKDERIAILTYHKFPGEDWPPEQFAEHAVRLAGGELVTLQLAERETNLASKLMVREVRKLSEGGHQTSILSTNYKADLTVLAASMFARWSQENFYKYMRQHYNLDRLVEYGTENIPDSIRTVNPDWRKLEGEIRSKNGQLQRLLALFGQLSLQGALAEPVVSAYEQRKGQQKEAIDNLKKEIDGLKLQRKNTAHHISVPQLPEADRFSRLLPERKHFLDTIKMVSYRAETSMASLLQHKLARCDDARALLRQIYATEVDLLPDLKTKTLTVRLHHLTQAAHDNALTYLCDELNATETRFPETDLRLVYRVGSS
jgi:hypothetical protein